MSPLGGVPRHCGGMDAQFGLEDQQNINQFSKLNAQLHELDSLITVQQVLRRAAASPALLRCSLGCRAHPLLAAMRRKGAPAEAPALRVADRPHTNEFR